MRQGGKTERVKVK